MAAFDGNAIGGLLLEIFGADLTSARSVCAACGATRPVAEAAVYLRGPGTVVRCRSCSAVLMVIARIRGMNCVDLGGLAALDVRDSGPARLATGSRSDDVPPAGRGEASR